MPRRQPAMFKWLNLLLLLLPLLMCLVSQSEITIISVSGKRGGRVTLKCDVVDSKISISFERSSKNIPLCQNEECEGERGRVFKRGSCDIIIKDLSFSDAGRYSLHVYYKNIQGELEGQVRTYQLHIQDAVSVKKGDEIKLGVLLPNANKVEKKSSGEWMEVWSRDYGVQSDRMAIRDENLIIKGFITSDAGTYVVLDHEGELLITVTFKDCGSLRECSGNKENYPRGTYDEKPTFGSCLKEFMFSRLPANKHWSFSTKLQCFFGIYAIIVAIAIIFISLLVFLRN